MGVIPWEYIDAANGELRPGLGDARCIVIDTTSVRFG
jgi:hypothetical protein